MCGNELEKDHAGYYCSNKDCAIRFCSQDEDKPLGNENLLDYMEDTKPHDCIYKA